MSTPARRRLMRDFKRHVLSFFNDVTSFVQACLMLPLCSKLAWFFKNTSCTMPIGSLVL
jgi:hypothetical protein